MVRIADTGLIVAALSRRDHCHAWAAASFRSQAPFVVCEAVLAEASSFFPDPLGVLHLVERGDLILDDSFNLAAELPCITALVKKYADHPMDLADACVVRMSEIHRRCKVWTVDRRDFQTYRRYGRERIPCEFPP
jgi:uncharacterized protein